MDNLKDSALVELVELEPQGIPDDLHEWLFTLPDSAAIRLTGRDRQRTRVVTVLLHGNEPSGLAAVRRFLRSGQVPRTNVLIIVGAAGAAKLEPVFSHRFLPGRRDLNRCFFGPVNDDHGRLAAAILAAIRCESPEAAIDLHNNSGHNPAYAVSTRVDAARLGITSLFAPRFVLSRLRLGTLVDALEDELPIVTIECGRRLDSAADELAYAGLCRFVEADELPRVPVDSGRIETLYHPVRVRVRAGLRIGFGDHRESGTDVTCAPDIDRYNFETLPADSHVAWTSEGVEWPFEAWDEAGNEVSAGLFRRDGRSIRTTREIIPIMMTTNSAIAVSDCLFYAVERR
jgi:hypothetical protein